MAKVYEDDLSELFKIAVRQQNERKIAKNKPISCYDRELKKPYILHPDGKKEYAK